MKSGFPYLVDISIGSYCPFACQFCYTSSTINGQYANPSFLMHDLATELFRANVFEVVFGGGEPTLYRFEDKYQKFDLSHILAAYRERNFKIGVTTKNYGFHKQPNFEKTVKLVNSFAISCNTRDEIDKAKNLRNEIEAVSYDTRVYAQMILGLSPYDEFESLFSYACKSASFDGVTLLGYKRFGFGQNDTSYDVPSRWISLAKDLSQRRSIGIDSILAQQWRDELVANGVSNYFLVGAEGESSCFVDAVSKTIRPSSFTDETYPFEKNQFLSTFRKF